MGDLGTLANGVSAPAAKFNPLNLGQEAPQALPPDTSKASKAQAHAALMGTVAQTLQQLPNIIIGNYMKGKQVGAELKTNSVINDALSGKTPVLPQGLVVTPNGASYKAPDPNAAALGALAIPEKNAEIELKKAQAAKALRGDAGMSDNPMLFVPPSTPAASAADTGFGRVTTYGDKNDSFGGPTAKSSTIGPDGKPLPADSLAVSPDVEKLLAAQGIGMGDKVEIKLANGNTVVRTLADRTAQDDEIAAGKIKGVTSPLRGRWDFRSVGGAIDPNTDSKVTGFAKHGAPAAAPGAGGALSGGVVAAQPAPALLAAPGGALAPSPDTGALSAAGSPDSPTVEAPAPAAGTPPAVAEDGSFDPAAAAEATGGSKITDKGHAGGPVFRFAGFDKEEGANGTTYIYPHKVKAGAKPYMEFIKAPKPVHYTAATMKLVGDSGYQPKEGEPEAAVQAAAHARLTELEKVPPDVKPMYFRWMNGLQSNPVVKEFYTARHQADVVEAALSKGLTPAAALGVIDGYVKAMRGGAATQGMTKILEEAQPLVQQLKLKWQKLTGGPGENAILTKEMAEDVRHILSRIEAASRSEVEAMKEGDKDSLSTFDIPPGAIEKTYRRILNGKKSSIDQMEPNSVLPGSSEAAPAVAATPEAAQAKKLEVANKVKAKYDAGAYAGADKERAEALLRNAGLLK